MIYGTFRFGDFTLDPANRQLRNGDEPVSLNARYFDALALLVQNPGKLISKDRFLSEVWRGVPVTDEALTQCIKTLRSVLGDAAAAPRFIETVPKHGYRFLAPVAHSAAPITYSGAPSKKPYWPVRAFQISGAGMIGGGIAGLLGGLFYGIVGVSRPTEQGGQVSVLLVLVCLCILTGLIGGAGVGLGIAASKWFGGRRLPWCVVGGASGGMIVGAAAKLLGLDAFSLIVGRSPGDITGAGEGLVLGAAAGLAVWVVQSSNRPLAQVVVGVAVIGAIAGLLIAALGGTLMGGSLDLLGQSLPNSRLSMTGVGAFFGEADFGPVCRTITSAVEGLLFVVGCGGAILLAWRHSETD